METGDYFVENRQFAEISGKNKSSRPEYVFHFSQLFCWDPARSTPYTNMAIVDALAHCFLWPRRRAGWNALSVDLCAASVVRKLATQVAGDEAKLTAARAEVERLRLT